MYVQLLDLVVGDRVRLHDGSIHEVVANPRDGIWIETRPIDDLSADTAVMTHCQEVKEVERTVA